MKKLLLLASLLLTFNTGDLKAGFYFGGFAGANFIQDDEAHFDLSYNTGYLLGTNLGYRFPCSGWRVEGEFSYRKNRVKRIEGRVIDFQVHGHQSYYIGMGNLYYDFYFPTLWIHPFVGAGVGWYDQKIDVSKNNISLVNRESKIGWQVLAGLAYEIDGAYEAVLMYRLFKPADEFYNHGATLGINYNF